MRDKIKEREYQRAYCKKHRERRSEIQRKSRKKNFKKVQARQKAYDQENRARKTLQARLRRHRNLEHAKTIRGIWRKKNSFWTNTCRRLYDFIKSEKVSAIKILGCDRDWLMAWLEVQFQPGMTWENYGAGWHVDHIKPCASFDLSDTHQRNLCFHWTNLRPLWASENLRKHAKSA